MSQPSNYKCISSDCARVVWREYLPAVVRWRYSGEEWQEIEADDYQVKTQPGQCNTKYFIEAEATYQGSNVGNLFVCGETMRIVSKRQFDGNIISVDKIENPENRAFGFAVVWKNRSGIIESFNVGVNGYKIGRTGGFGTIVWNDECRFVNYNSGGKNIRNVQIKRVDGKEDNCGDCEFIVYKNGEIVHQETRDDCPEVEQLPCRLSDRTHIVQIDKTPYLSAIEVTQLDNDAIRIKGVPFPLKGVGKAPDECWNIYRNEIFDPFPSGDPEEPNEPAFGDYITQICSAANCPPPEYEVICGCEECPPNTCGVICGFYLCCYDIETGKAVKSILLTNIPNFGIPDNTVGLNDIGGNIA